MVLDGQYTRADGYERNEKTKKIAGLILEQTGYAAIAHAPTSNLVTQSHVRYDNQRIVTEFIIAPHKPIRCSLESSNSRLASASIASIFPSALLALQRGDVVYAELCGCKWSMIVENMMRKA